MSRENMNSKTEWSRAVWVETQPNGKMEEFEMTIPCKWIKDGKVYWPNHLNVTHSFNNMEEPTSAWKVFKLIKLKLERGNFFSYLVIFDP